MKIRNDYDLEKLITEWGFKKNGIDNTAVYKYIMMDDNDKSCDILVNINGAYDRTVYFYYRNDLDTEFEYEYNNYDEIIDVLYDGIDYAIEIPDILFEMIKKGIIVK